MLDGYKTYIFAIMGVILATIYGMGYIDQTTFLFLLSCIGFSGLASLRSAIKKIISGK